MKETRTAKESKAADGGSTAWKRAASLADLAEGTPLEVLVGRTLVMLIREGDAIRALDGLCPHSFARLAAGKLDREKNGIGALLTCPAHGARFDLETGRCVANWVLPPLRRYPVRIENGDVLLPDPLQPLPA